MTEALYTKTFKLPSANSKLYPNNPELKGDITIRMMTMGDEKKIYGSYTYEAINNLIKSCVVEPANFDVDILIPSDRYFVLIQLRMLSYGEEYHSMGKCLNCKHEGLFKMSIADVPIIEAPAELEEIVEITLKSKPVKVGLKILNEKDIDSYREEGKIMAEAQNLPLSEVLFILRLEKLIATIDGNIPTAAEKQRLLKELTPRDRAYIDYSLAKNNYGFVTFAKTTCPKCGKEVEVNFGITEEFFRPIFDD